MRVKVYRPQYSDKDIETMKVVSYDETDFISIYKYYNKSFVDVKNFDFDSDYRLLEDFEIDEEDKKDNMFDNCDIVFNYMNSGAEWRRVYSGCILEFDCGRYYYRNSDSWSDITNAIKEMRGI